MPDRYLRFLAAGVLYESDSQDDLTVDHIIWCHRCWWQAYRDAREAGDFQAMLTAEINARLAPDCLVERLAPFGQAAEPVRAFMEAERRLVLDRTERCGECWYTFKGPPEHERRQAGYHAYDRMQEMRGYRFAARQYVCPTKWAWRWKQPTPAVAAGISSG
jgi:hypothetical protein